MSKKNRKSGGEVHSQNWQDYEEETELLYSYVKKKGKHQRAKNTPTDKKF